MMSNQALIVDESFLNNVSVNDMTRDQLETRAMRMFLDNLHLHNNIYNISLLDTLTNPLPAITDSFENMDGLFDAICFCPDFIDKNIIVE